MQRLADKKLQNELDISRIIRKIRSFTTVSNYLLNERQKYLLKFNYNHVVDTQSELISLDSAQTLFSVPEEDETRTKTIKKRVMLKLLDDDPRDEMCALRLINRQLEKGCKKINPDETIEGV